MKCYGGGYETVRRVKEQRYTTYWSGKGVGFLRSKGKRF